MCSSFCSRSSKMLPVLHTFIHFRIVSSHASRSLSAPPVLISSHAKAPCMARPGKHKRKRRQKPDADTIVIEDFARETIKEKWKLLAARFCQHSRQAARSDLDRRHHQLTLPKELFLDVAFYAFQKDSNKALLKLFQAGVLTEPVDDEVWICCSRRQLQQKHWNPVRKLLEEGKKALEAARTGHFRIVFNSAVIIFLQWNSDLTVSAVIHKVMQVLCQRGCAHAIAMHRNTTLRGESKLGVLGLRAGCTLAVTPL